MKTQKVFQDLRDEETRLWDSLLQGDALAFEALITSCYDLLFQYGQKFVADRELVKDAIQDVFLEIWEKRQKIDSSIPPKAYLLACLRRRLHRMQKKSWPLLFTDPSDTQSDFMVEFSAEYQHIEREKDRLLAAQMTALLHQLPSRQQEAIYLRFFKGLDRYAIAEIMEIHPQSVSNLLQTAFKWLKTKWVFVVSTFGYLLSAFDGRL
ncbi:RNA polymerase sigma factor (sigma-70 family) [Dyadobacter jejuensis]|uniref:RNA polymerase sigma factor (Sigma-70 family) n=1 Tax=Dyadobacter jejuensis TaxID=1082580 RepID=A0A316AMD2_9BACT|nr:sigma-70 family RNA polymerase sigma factor [Dyadobacter jejuensis]PWJ58721.1 RNA polymerase sigma factor (sigma-70 family) [Dyadobacter jejuensis]